MAFENITNYLPQSASKVSHNELANAALITHYAQKTLINDYPLYAKYIKKYAYKDDILYLFVATDASYKALSTQIDAFLRSIKYTELAVCIEKIVVKKA